LHIDDRLVPGTGALRDLVKPAGIFACARRRHRQEAVNRRHAFQTSRWQIRSILTKLDGDARGRRGLEPEGP